MRFSSIFILILLLLTASPASSPAARSSADVQTVVATLEGGYALLEDLQADFSQKTTIASMKREERGGGELFIKKPANAEARFRFNYVKPKQQIISNGTKIWYYLPDNKQVIMTESAKMFSGGNGVVLNYLTGLGHVSRDFTITFVGDGRDKKGNYVLELVPKKASPMLAKLQLTLSATAVDKFMDTGSAQEPFPVTSSLVVDNLGNKTAIEYNKVKTNKGMKNTLFNFKIPAGIEVIQQ